MKVSEIFWILQKSWAFLHTEMKFKDVSFTFWDIFMWQTLVFLIVLIILILKNRNGD